MAISKGSSRSAATLRDVARAAGVHPGTASRALNEKTRPLVNDETARRVLDAAATLGYRPNRIARGLRTSRSYTVGVLLPDITNPLFPPIVRGIEDRLGEGGYTPLFANTDNDPQRERIYFEAMWSRQVDGFITATARRTYELLDELSELAVPLVLVNRRVEDGSLTSATVDDAHGVRLAVEHLAELGHRRIAHIAGPQELTTGHQRLEGFLEAMRAVGLKPDRDLIPVADAFTESGGAAACRELLASGEPFTAIVAANDLLALGCYDVFAERAIACPEEVSVVGFNDMPFVDSFNPPLTTIRVPHYDMGVAAAQLLLDLLRQPRTPPREIVFTPDLVARGSAAAPPHGGG